MQRTQTVAETTRDITSANGMEREIIFTRVFDAPLELVFKAWTDPQLMTQWWGPQGFTNSGCELDVRVGGKWHIVMHGPDGTEYPCGGVYREIMPSQRLAFTNNAIDKQGNPLLEGFTIVTFEEHDGKTRLTLETRAIGLVPQAPQMLAGMHTGWSQSLDRLAGFVEPDPIRS
jgi:uncharacterized protein YndB with AHSA1/START domain